MRQTIKGVVGNISDVITMKRNVKGSQDIKKKIITLLTPDGQRLYIDVINKKMNLFKEQDIKKFSVIEVEYLFKGTDVGERKFNNVYAVDIKIINIPL